MIKKTKTEPLLVAKPQLSNARFCIPIRQLPDGNEKLSGFGNEKFRKIPMKQLSNFLNYKEFCAAILRLDTSQRSCVKLIIMPTYPKIPTELRTSLIMNPCFILNELSAR